MRRSGRQKQRDLLTAELNLCPGQNNRTALLHICLVSPSRYQAGMSSLGFQTVYRLFSSCPGIICDRAFLPERDELSEHHQRGTQMLSLEQGKPLADFDIIAFSTSFEPDFLNIPLILDLSRIPPLSAERDETHPLIIAGGAAFFINPEPVADFLDIICVGEGEEIIPGLVDALLAPGSGARKELLDALSVLPGIYIPARYPLRHEQGRLVASACKTAGAPPVVKVCANLEQHPPAQSVILTDNTEFGDMFLIEVSRGCPRGCRFCTSGFIYGAFRQHPLDAIMAAVDEGLIHRNKIGLVGAAVSDYRDIGRLCRHIVDRGAKVSVSSLRIDRLDTDMLDALVACGHKTITMAPEGGSQRLRDLIRKNLTEEQILDACDMVVARDIINLKLYFIIGLPTETEADLEELARLVIAIRERVLERARINRRLGEITISVNPFIPKPFTPFQWCPMEPIASLERKAKYLEQRFRNIANVQLKMESLKASRLQALLSRGDRSFSRLLLGMSRGDSLKKATRECGIDVDACVNGAIPLDAPLPWDILGTGEKDALRREYLRAFREGGGHDETV